MPAWLAASPSAASVVHAWLLLQGSLCVRCLTELSSLVAPSSASSPSSAGSSAARTTVAGEVGGRTFAEADFLRVYACLLLTRLLLRATLSQAIEHEPPLLLLPDHDEQSKQATEARRAREAGWRHFYARPRTASLFAGCCKCLH